MTDRLEDILLAYLRQLTAMHNARPVPPDGRRYRSHEELILDRGRAWTPAPLGPGARRGQPRYCYFNTLELTARYPDLRYCEGYAVPMVDGWTGIPVVHAWAVDPDDRVWDPTWPEPERSAYYGMTFSRAEVARFLELSEDCFGILETEYRIGFPLLMVGRLFPTEADPADEAIDYLPGSTLPRFTPENVRRIEARNERAGLARIARRAARTEQEEP